MVHFVDIGEIDDVTVFIFCFIILGKNVVDDYHCFSNLLDRYSTIINVYLIC